LTLNAEFNISSSLKSLIKQSRAFLETTAMTFKSRARHLIIGAVDLDVIWHVGKPTILLPSLNIHALAVDHGSPEFGLEMDQKFRRFPL
jgi:hypothetical protein